jgi:hypothetical protein
MLSPPPRPWTETGPPGRGPPTRSVPTSIASEFFRGLGSPLGSRADLDLDRVERLDVASPDQGEEGPQPRSAGLALTDTLLPPRTAGARERLPPRRPRAYGCNLPSGGGRVGPRDTGVAAGAAGRADSEVLGVPPVGERIHKFWWYLGRAVEGESPEPDRQRLPG